MFEFVFCVWVVVFWLGEMRLRICERKGRGHRRGKEVV